MFQRIRSKLTYANVVSSICLFLVLGGGAAFAAKQLAKNSVGTKQIKKNAVTGEKVKDASLTGADIKLSTLGTVPKATSADSASKASDADKLGGAAASSYVKGSDAVGGSALAGTYASPSLKAAEAIHQVGTAGNAAFEVCKGAGATPLWVSPSSPTVERVYYYRDPYGTVHVGGSVKCSETPENGHNVFTLPAGFRPTNQLDFATSMGAGTGTIEVLGNGRVVFSGSAAGEARVSLDGIDFRCAPSGANGCP